MRESIGSTWILQLVIVFMLIFVAFLALSINYTKAFKIKNELISIIEKYEGATTDEQGSISIINNYLVYQGYHTMSSCEEGSYGVKNLNSTSIDEAQAGTKYYYCIRKMDTSNYSFPDRAYYEVEVFFQFNLPVVGDIFTFRAGGKTVDINWSQDDLISRYRAE